MIDVQTEWLADGWISRVKSQASRILSNVTLMDALILPTYLYLTYFASIFPRSFLNRPPIVPQSSLSPFNFTLPAKMDLKKHYLSYIARINSGQCDSGALSPFVHEGIVHNDSPPLSVEEYAKIIADTQSVLPGLHFETELLAAESARDAQGQPNTQGDGTVAVRVKMSYKPTPTTDETFYEHVFYRFQGGKISKVWSLLDEAALKWKEERMAATQ